MVDQVARATSRSIYGAQGVRRGSRPATVARDQLGSYSAWARRHRASRGRRAAARARRTNITMGRVSGHRSSGTRTAHGARLRGARSDVRKTRSDALDKGRPAASVVDYRTWDAAQPGGARAIRRAPAAGRKRSREVTL